VHFFLFFCFPYHTLADDATISAMPRARTATANAKREANAKRAKNKVTPNELPTLTKQTMIEGLLKLGWRPSSPKAALTQRNINRVRQILYRNNKIPMRRIARQTGIDKQTVCRIVAKLNKKSYKMGRGQHLTDVQKQRRFLQAQKMRDEINRGRLDRIVFSDEKIFTVEPRINRQNCRQILSKRLGRKDKRYKTVGHSLFPSRLFGIFCDCDFSFQSR
jgi:Holliday junction resolvasome RuvABC DNA-binding subunit